jgi:hypothetical protein
MRRRAESGEQPSRCTTRTRARALVFEVAAHGASRIRAV